MKQIFINLPVEDIEKSNQFYQKLGFKEYPLFTGENQKCIAWSEEILIMLQTKEFFSSGGKKAIANTKNSISASFTLPVKNLEKVNEIVAIALENGGKEPSPMVNVDFMQIRTIEDLDGHTWGIICLDLEKFKKQKTK